MVTGPLTQGQGLLRSMRTIGRWITEAPDADQPLQVLSWHYEFTQLPPRVVRTAKKRCVQSLFNRPRALAVCPDQIPRLAETAMDIWGAENAHLDIIPALYIGAYTGFRCRTIKALWWEDVDWKQRLITAHVTKGDQPFRIPMPKPLHAILESIRSTRADPTGWIVGPYQMHRRQQRWRVDVRMGQLGLSWHQLRRGYAVYLVREGVSPAIVARLLNHRNLTTLLRYIELSANDMQAAVQEAFKDL